MGFFKVIVSKLFNVELISNSSSPKLLDCSCFNSIDNGSAANLLQATTKCDERLNSVVAEGKRRSLWFHVGGGRSSCHVIAVIPDGTNKKNVKYIVTQGALLCKKFSRYASEKDLEIIYTLRVNVTKTDVAGKVDVSMYKTKII